jgi:hypothetical protein
VHALVGVCFVVEACSAEAQQAGAGGVVGAALSDEFADMHEAFDVSDAHRLVPLGFSDGQERRLGVSVSDADDGHIDRVAGPGFGIMDDAVADTGGQAAE